MSSSLRRLVLIGVSLFAFSACGEEDGTSDSTGEATTATETAAETTASETGTGDSTTTDATTDTTGTDTTGTDTTGTDTSTTGGGAACFADGGIYGKCSENACELCLQGATVYQSCSKSCATAADCGDPNDFQGATPGCFPLNPGAADMICVLLCTTTEDCPCGLDCQPSGAGANICAESQ